VRPDDAPDDGAGGGLVGRVRHAPGGAHPLGEAAEPRHRRPRVEDDDRVPGRDHADHRRHRARVVLVEDGDRLAAAADGVPHRGEHRGGVGGEAGVGHRPAGVDHGDGVRRGGHDRPQPGDEAARRVGR
jgi:hypothetical protein